MLCQDMLTSADATSRENVRYHVMTMITRSRVVDPDGKKQAKPLLAKIKSEVKTAVRAAKAAGGPCADVVRSF